MFRLFLCLHRHPAVPPRNCTRCLPTPEGRAAMRLSLMPFRAFHPTAAADAVRYVNLLWVERTFTLFDWFLPWWRLRVLCGTRAACARTTPCLQRSWALHPPHRTLHRTTHHYAVCPLFLVRCIFIPDAATRTATAGSRVHTAFAALRRDFLCGGGRRQRLPFFPLNELPHTLPLRYRRVWPAHYRAAVPSRYARFTHSTTQFTYPTPTQLRTHVYCPTSCVDVATGATPSLCDMVRMNAGYATYSTAKTDACGSSFICGATTRMTTNVRFLPFIPVPNRQHDSPRIVYRGIHADGFLPLASGYTATQRQHSRATHQALVNRPCISRQFRIAPRQRRGRWAPATPTRRLLY